MLNITFADPKPITEKEACFLTGVIFSQFNDSETIADWPVWTWDPCDFYQNINNSAGTGGVVASLETKGFLDVNNSEADPDDHAVAITKQGLVAWQIFTRINRGGRTIQDWFSEDFVNTLQYGQTVERAYEEADAATATN